MSEHTWVMCDNVGERMGTSYGQQRYNDWLCVHCGIHVRPSNKGNPPENSQISPTCDEMVVASVQEEEVVIRIGRTV